jgi:uncharacterized protein (TIRG00374 family)
MTAEQDSRAGQSVLRNVARAVVSVAILAIIASRIDLDLVWEISRAADLAWIVLAFALALGGRIFAAIRWYLLLYGSNPGARFGRIVRLVFVSSLFGMFLPGMLGVDVIRVYGLSKSTSDLALAFTSVMVERLLATAVLVVLVLVSLFFVPPGLPDGLMHVAQVGLFLIVVGSLAIMQSATRAVGDHILDALRLAPIKIRLHKIYKALDYYKTKPMIMAWSVVAAVVAVAFRIVPAVVIAIALGLEIPLVHFAIFLPLIHFATQVPISIGGLGVRETAFVILFGLVGVSNEEAFTLSLIVYLVTVCSALPGAWFYARGGIAEDSRESSRN